MLRRILVSVLFALLSAQGWAAPSILHDNGITSSATASGTIQPTTAPTAGNLGVLMIAQSCASTAETITDSASNTWTKGAGAATNADNCASIWYAKLTSVAGSPYTVNYSGISTVATPNGFEFLEIINFDTTALVDGTPQATNYASAAGTTITQPVGTASIANNLALIVGAYNSSETTTPTAPVTTLQVNNSTLPTAMWTGSGTITGTGATTLAGTISVSTKLATAGLMVKATAGSTCTHSGITSGGAIATPNGTTGSYWLSNGTFGTPNCSSTSYWRPTLGSFGVN